MRVPDSRAWHVASDSAIKTKRAAIADLVHRLDKARLWSLDHLGDYAKSTAEITRLPEDVLLAAYGAQRTSPIAIDDGVVSEVQAAADRATRYGILSKTIDVSKDTSLNGIARAINADDEAGVTAAILTDGDGKSYLQLTSADTGTKKAVTSITSTNSTIQSAIGYDASATPTGGMSELVGATDAKATINGVEIVSGSNTLDKNIDNVTITLSDVTTDPVTVNIATDPSGVVSAVQNFVTSYNALQTLVKSLTKYDSTTDQGSTLTGDSTTRSIDSMLSGALRVLASGTDTLNTIADLGITTDPTDGSLDLDLNRIDSTHLHSLNDSLSSNPKDVGDILTALGKSVGTAINGILGSNGLLATRTAGLNETQKTLQDQYDSVSDRIDADIANIRAQFVQLDAFVAQMNSTSSYLTQQFAALSGQSK